MSETIAQEETAELLVELYSEEIPWKLQEPMASNLEKFLQEELAKALGLKNTENTFGESRVYWTPRRVAVGIADIPIRSKAWEEERKGPKASSPRVAIEGFLRANNLSLKECQRKGEHWVFMVKHAAISTNTILGGIVVRVIERMAKALPITMRFGGQSFRWVRPLRHIMVVFAGEGVKGALELGNEKNLPFTSETCGHPLAAPDAIAVTGIKDYEDKLRKNYVEPSYEKRLDKIFKGVVGNPDYDYQKVQPEKYRLMKENACLIECPVVLKGHFDKEFMDLPSFLISTVLIDHQKIIRAPKDNSGEGEFFIITNTPHVTQEHENNTIIKGFERVVRARLADAKFMWERDKKIPVKKFIGKLSNITFHPKLGTIADKNERTKKLIPVIFKTLENNNCNYSTKKEYDAAGSEEQVDELKFDLSTETVREFPSLHKLIGKELTVKNFDPHLFQEHGIIEIADNIDTLVSLWSAGEKPTGSGDPFALRRYALTVISHLGRKYCFRHASLPLKNIFKDALGMLSIKNLDDSSLPKYSWNLMLEEIISFMLERLRVYFKDHEQLPHDCIEAVLAHGDAQECNINMLYLNAINIAKEIKSNNPLSEIFTRLHAILRPYSDDFSPLSSSHSPDLFTTVEEKNLHARTQSLADEAWQKLTFQAKLQTLGSLKDVVDSFFDNVLVMHKNANIRQNRLRLLYSIYKRFWELADFTKIHHKDKQLKTKQEKNKQQQPQQA